jgi:hypothetical protein
MRRSYTRIVEPSVTLQRVDQMEPGGPRCGGIDADRVIDALGEGGVEELALILEVIPAFEQEDGSVLDDLAASVDYWLEALARRGVLAG